MTEKTSAELEHDAEVARANVSDTADSIRNKMTPGQLIDEFSGIFRGGDDGSLLTTLKEQVRDNPLPVALVGVGLAWLMAGQGSGKPEYTRSASSTGHEGQDASSSMTDALTGAAKKTASTVGDAVEGIVAGATDTAHRLSDKAGSYSSVTIDSAAKAGGAFADVLRQEPLVLAALGLALGTAAGALLPHTDFEDEQLGPTSGKLRDQATQIFEQGVEGAKEVAADAYQTVKDEADKQGLPGGESGVVDQVSEIVKSTASKTEKSIRDKLHGVSDKLSGEEK